MNNYIDNKTILVTGGTGSFGSTFVKKILKEYSPKKVIVFSRDEDKQHSMRLALNDSRVEFQIGDTRDRQRVSEVMAGVNVVFHAAALKQVPAGEFFPMEVVKTNVLGASHVLDAAVSHKVERVVVLSTDKAVYPINAMGMTKALMEKLAIAKSLEQKTTKICVTRYGNVMCSRGSIIPIWLQAAKNNKTLTVTHPSMTRFLLSLDDAVDLVLYAINNTEGGEVFIKKAPACTMYDLAQAVIAYEGKSTSDIKVIGIRHGEKVHETLINDEEMRHTVDCGGYYKVLPDTRDLNYNLYFSEGQEIKEIPAYTSGTTTRLDKEQTLEIIKTVLQ